MIRIAKTPKQANESAIRIFERLLIEEGWVKKDSFVKADSDAAAAGLAAIQYLYSKFYCTLLDIQIV